MEYHRIASGFTEMLHGTLNATVWRDSRLLRHVGTLPSCACTRCSQIFEKKSVSDLTSPLTLRMYYGLCCMWSLFFVRTRHLCVCSSSTGHASFRPAPRLCLVRAVNLARLSTRMPGTRWCSGGRVCVCVCVNGSE